MKGEAQVFEGGRLGQHMIPNMPRARRHAVEDHNPCLGTADGEAQSLQLLCMLSRHDWSPEDVQDSNTTSTAYTKEDTHLSEPSWTSSCNAVTSKWPCRPSKKMPNRDAKQSRAEGGSLAVPHSAGAGRVPLCPPPSWKERAVGMQRPDGRKDARTAM